MTANEDTDRRETKELPPYTAILIVDVVDFSGRPGRDHARMTEAIPGILRQAFRRAGLIDHWDENKFEAGTGDGYVVGFRPAVLPFLLHPFLPALQEELAYRNKVAAETGQERPLRMRVTVHVGPVESAERTALSAGSGTARIEAHRLIDAQPVRDLLTRSAPATCVAAIVSARVFADAVQTGYTADDPNLYVPAPVKVKSYEGSAYLRVPVPSGELLTHGFRAPGQDAEPTGEQAPATSADTAVDGPSTTTNTAGDVRGSIVQAGTYSDNRRGGTGAITGDGNITLTDSQGAVHIGGWDGGHRRPKDGR